MMPEPGQVIIPKYERRGKRNSYPNSDKYIIDVAFGDWDGAISWPHVAVSATLYAPSQI